MHASGTQLALNRSGERIPCDAEAARACVLLVDGLSSLLQL